MFKSVGSSIARCASIAVKRHCCYVNQDPAFPAAPACFWTVLPNGVRVISEQTASDLAAVGLFIEAGPRFETACNNGITHFIEHMAYKGFNTINRLQFEETLRFMGAKFTAHTMREIQIFRATCPSECAGVIVDYLSKIINDLEICGYQVEFERSVINQEMNELEKNAKLVLFDYLHASAFQGTPLGQRVIGPTRNIDKFDRFFTRDFLCEHYQPYRLVLALSGKFTHQQAVCFAQSSFGPMLQTCSDQGHGPCRFTGSEAIFRDDSMPFAHVAIAVEVPGYTSPEYYTLKVMQHMLGSYDVTRGGSYERTPYLAQAGAIAKHCMKYEPFYVAYRDIGLWGVYFVANKMDLEDMVYNIQTAWMSMCITTQYYDIQRGINEFKFRAAQGIIGSINSCYDMGIQMMYTCERKNIYDVYDALSKIKVHNIVELGDRYIFDRCPVVAAVGPTENLPEYNRIRSGMYWLRY